VAPGDRLPDYLVHTPHGDQRRIHDLCSGHFTALYVSDVRRRPVVPQNGSPALHHYVLSRYDAPHDSGLRDRSLLDPGSALAERLGVPPNTLVLVRPDEYIAAIVPLNNAAEQAAELYRDVTGMLPVEGARS
jgi:3-(3-hydroxy-phenyl)propionate hydroxylase